MPKITHYEARTKIIYNSNYADKKLLNQYVDQEEKKDLLIDLKNVQISILNQDIVMTHIEYIKLLDQIKALEDELK